LTLLAAATIMAYMFITPGIAARFFVSMGLTILIINSILKVINELQRRLVEQAITDPLTGAFNRRHMESRLNDAIERNRRTGASASLILLDIDYFKRINDQFGHAVGDNVLKALVKLLNTHSRKLDLLFRVGGEEFMLLLPDMRKEGALTLAEHFRGLIADSQLLVNCPLSVSQGVSEYEPGEALDSWIRRADDALYVAKKEGRNRVACSETVMPDPALNKVVPIRTGI
jgi:diguanylate cyclase (GGDEF)-like protein